MKRWLFLLVIVMASTTSVRALQWPKSRSITARSVAMAPHGMVATSHPLAAEVGLDVLKRGGNAIDAAIAANAAMGLMEPMSCGVGGDLFAIVWDAKTHKMFGLNASGRSPYRATRALFAERGLKEIPLIGPLSWSVPGCVDGWDALAKRFGSLPLADLLEPSIHYAEEGFPVAEVIGGYWHNAENKLLQDAEATRTYLIDGQAPKAGTLFRNPNLARTYRAIAQGGRDAFYRGPIAKEIVAYSDRVGGLFSDRDFADHTSTWIEPVSTNYRGYDVWELPPPGQGIATLQMLNMLEAYDLKKMGPLSPDYWHLFVEAKKLAYEDRARFYSDPDFAPPPTAELISKDYARKRAQLIDSAKAQTKVLPGSPKLEMGDTIYLCVVDKNRNCVSLIESNYQGFGSGMVPGNLGFALQNRGTLLALDPKHRNRLEPHKRPFHTIIPALVTKDQEPWLVFGVMGGDMQPQGQVQILCNMIDFGMNVQQAGEFPRLEHLGSSTPTGRKAKAGGRLAVEISMPSAITDELTRRGHEVTFTPTNSGGYQGIMIDRAAGLLKGGTEPRKDGSAVGY
ncbi:MAG TPA: gamma-glutamyltransferase [Gemmataceae bacterium]|jgi:gamma-glutamyltranspeptidase/glutathione hydrolase|nr:gamma-glutamyltransferase [Gemmataceae bacterium]